MSEQTGQFDFCPKCGALARDGECQSCGYRLEGVKIQKQESTMQTSGMDQTYEASQTYNEKSTYGSYAQQNYDNVKQEYSNEYQGNNNSNQNYNNVNQGYNGTPQNGYNPNAGYSQDQGYAHGQGYNQNQGGYNQNPGYNQNSGYGQNQGYTSNQGSNQNSNVNQGYQPNYGPPPAYSTYQPGKSKGSNVAIIVASIVGFVVLFVCISVGIITYQTVKSTKLTATEPIQEEPDDPGGISGEGDGSDNIQKEKGLGKEEEKRKEDGAIDAYKNASEDDYFLKPGYISSWGGNHVNHTRAEFTGKYYNNVCECIDYTVPYKINREYYEYISPDKNITIRLAYIQLDGDIPNLDQLNEQILSYSSYLAGYYFENYSEEDIYDGWVDMSTDSYVVYNDENKMSIVLDENWNIDEEYSMDLYAINIDLETGMILDNNTVLDFTDELSAKFRERSNEQNGIVEGMEALTDGEITEFLSDTSSSIVFYTPIGMEVGYNYFYEGSSGWVTASFPDYQDYIKSF